MSKLLLLVTLMGVFLVVCFLNEKGGEKLVALNRNVVIAAKDSKSVKRPIALIHLGNRKTASTSIQRFLAGIPEILKLDGWVYFGHGQASYIHGPSKHLRDCVVRDLLDPCPVDYVKAWERFEQDIDQHFRNGTNVVYSDEDIPRYTAENPSKALDEIDRVFSKFERHVTVSYRHYFEWLLSEYNQQNKKRITRLVQGFVDWHRESGKTKDSLLEPLTKDHLVEYSRRFDSVTVFNMHETTNKTGGIVGDWICSMFPWAKTACADLRSGRLALEHDNPSVDNLESRRLVQLAWSEGGTKLRQLKKTSESAILCATEKVGRWLDQSGMSNLPKSCLTQQELDELWSRSTRIRDELVPGYDPLNEVLKERFEKAMSQFCQIDYAGLNSSQTELGQEWDAIIAAAKAYC